MSFIYLLLCLISIISNAQINTFYRRDYFLDDTKYPESLPDPNVGGRFHLIMPANKKNGVYPQYKTPYTVSFTKISVKIDPSTTLPDIIDWIYCDYQQSTGQIFVSGHIPNDNLLEDFATFTITDSTGAQMARYLNVGFKHAGLQLYYVTIRDLDSNRQQLITHWYCYYADTAFDIATLYFNGIQIGSNIPVGALQHSVFTYNLTTKINPGDIYTLHVILKDGLQMGFGGRYTNPKQKFSIVGLPINSQCPYPDTNNANYKTLSTDLSINSLYITANSTCSSDVSDVLKYYSDNWSNSLNVNGNDLTLETSLSATQDALSDYSNLDDFVSALTVYKELEPVDINATKINTSITANIVWQESLKRRIYYPSSMTVINSFTNHEVGTYAGITDIQLASFLMAGCGEISLTSTGPFPVTASYDYLRNARLNHMPEPIWGVIQMPGGGYLTQSEVTLSFGQAIAAGVNGFVVLATDVTQKTSDSDAWNAASSLMNSIQYLEDKGIMRVLSADGAKINSGNTTSLWSALRGVEEMVVVAVNLNCNGYDPSKCSKTNTPHWTCSDTMVQTVNMTVPPDWQSMKNLKINVMEIVNGKEEQVGFKVSLENNNMNLIFSNVPLDKDNTTRIFLLTTA